MLNFGFHVPNPNSHRQIIPPGLVLTPTRRPPSTPRLAFQSKSLSTGNLFDKDDREDIDNDNDDNAPNVIKSWWNKFSNRWGDFILLQIIR